MLPRHHRPTVRAFAALILATAIAAPVAAQDQPTEFQSWRIPGWTFTPGMTVGALYDTNVTLSPPDVNKRTPTDKLFQFEPFGQLAYFSPRTTFSGTYQGALRRYFDLGSLDGTDHRAYVTLHERISRRVTFFANDSYSQLPTTDQLDLAGVPYLRTGSRYNSLAGGIEARATRSTDVVVRYEMTWLDFVRKDTLLTGGMVNGVHGEVTHRLGQRASLGVESGTRWADLNQGTETLNFQDGGGVFRYRTGSNTTFEAAGGVAHLVDHSTQVTRTGPYVRVDLTRRGERVSYGVGYNRSYVPSLAFGGTNQSQEARGYIQMPLDRNRFYVQESASWRRTDPFVTTELALDSMFVETVLGYAVQKWFRVEGYDAFTTQDNRVAAGKITRNVAGVRFVVSEPMRIR
jgi:hypothetical protein